VPPERLTLREALVLGRMRWQIELLFKLWKSHGHVDESRSTKPWRILCEVYAKLLAMLVQHWVFLVSLWAYPDRSLPKAAQTVQK
jgi:IS4 transposase